MTGRLVGIYQETKNLSFHDTEGLSMEKPLLEILSNRGYKGPEAPVVIQSFDPANLKQMRFDLKTDFPLAQLISRNSGPAGIFDRAVRVLKAVERSD